MRCAPLVLVHTIHILNSCKMNTEIQLPTVVQSATLKLSENAIGTFGALTESAVDYGFSATNLTKEGTAVIINAINADGSKKKYILSKELSKLYKAGEIQLNHLFDLDVRTGPGDDGETVNVICKPAQEIKVSASKVRNNAKPFAPKVTMTDAEIKALVNVEY